MRNVDVRRGEKTQTGVVGGGGSSFGISAWGFGETELSPRAGPHGVSDRLYFLITDRHK